MKIRSLVVLLAAGVALALSGCASQPAPAEMSAAIAGYQLPRQPEAGKALVYVMVPEAWYSALQFDVYLDGQTSQSAIGHNRGGQHIYFSVSPGEHKIYSREYSNTSKGQGWTDFTFSAKPGDIIFLRQEMVMGWVDVENRLKALLPDEGRYYVKNTNLGTLLQGEFQSAQIAPAAASPVPAAGADTFRGKVTGGNLAKGVGFSNINIKLLVTPEGGEPVTFFVRSDSKVFDASGKQVDYQQAFKTFGKRVEIEHFLIQDASGGEPGRNDFKYEIGQKGVRTLRILD